MTRHVEEEEEEEGAAGFQRRPLRYIQQINL